MAKKKKKPVWRFTEEDYVFFQKHQIFVGTKIETASMFRGIEHWIVRNIITHEIAANGEKVERNVKVVEKTTDIINMTKVGSNKETRTAKFAYMRYSATFRIA